jgi:hypothetical protein
MTAGPSIEPQEIKISKKRFPLSSREPPDYETSTLPTYYFFIFMNVNHVKILQPMEGTGFYHPSIV